MIARQTWAILLDSYRELNAKKLFWITMILSGFIVGAFAAVGITEDGMTIFTWTLDTGVFNSNNISTESFYKLMFVNLGIQFWLAWIAMILALVSTAGIFPDLVQSGSIDLMLSKPISRTRLFLTKYLCGLLFVVLQVGVFTAASFLVIGIRGGAWELGLFLAVPIVALVFSYLFGLMALLGVITRSTIASLLLTILVWFLIFLMNSADNILLSLKMKAELEVDRHVLVIERTEEKLDELRDRRVALETELAEEQAEDTAPTGEDEDPAEENDRLANLDKRISVGEGFLERLEGNLESRESTAASLAPWHRAIFTTKTILPKTAETTELLRRWLVDIANLQEAALEEDAPEVDEDLNAFFQNAPEENRLRSTEVTQQELQQAMIAELDKRSVAWVIGTSLGFEAVMVGVAALLFRRRDF